MIIGKLWGSFRAQMNKLANFFWTADPIAQMQYEYDQAVEQLKGGREGLAQYRALVEKVSQQANTEKTRVAQLESRVKAYLQAGDRTTAAKFALDLQKAKESLADKISQMQMHETSYENNVTKIKNATGLHLPFAALARPSQKAKMPGRMGDSCWYPSCTTVPWICNPLPRS